MVYAENEGEVFLGRSVTRQTSVSEETQRKVDGEIRRIIDEQYALARKLIEENRDKIEAMTKALLEFETIDADQIKDIMEGREVRPPKPSTMRFQPKRDGDGASGGSAEAAKPAVKEPPAAEGVQ
jgi:cell division protease FtsH